MVVVVALYFTLLANCSKIMTHRDDALETFGNGDWLEARIIRQRGKKITTRSLGFVGLHGIYTNNPSAPNRTA